MMTAFTTRLLTKQSDRTPEFTEYFSSIGCKGAVVLPDGSQVLTNSTTLLVYPSEFTGDTRTVYLIGEADFSVQKDPKRPFTVKTEQLDITALGTRFNVASYADDPTVSTALIEGSIRVTSRNDQQSHILTPGKQLSYNKESRTTRVAPVDLDDITAWQRNEMVFKSIEVEDILRMLERKYEITFQYRKGTFNHDKYNFRFRESSPLPEIMDIIQTVAGTFDYVIAGKVCYLEKR